MPTYSNPNWPTVAWQWDPAYGPTETTRRWRSLTARVATEGVSSGVYSTAYGRQYELSTVETGTASVRLDNSDEALSPGNLGSPFQVMSGWQFRQSAVMSGTGVAQFVSPIQTGSLVVVITSGTPALVSLSAIKGGKAFTSLGSVVASGYTLAAWGTIALQGGDTTITTSGSGTWTGVALEYVGAGDIGNLDVVASTSVTAGSYTSVGTGTTAAAAVGDLRLVMAAPCNYAAASTPTSPTWSTSTQRVSSTSPGSGTAALNSRVFVGDFFPTTATTQTDTGSWTNAAATALGMVITIKRSPTVQLGTPPVGSMATIPYRPLRHWAMWPPVPSGTGNLLNATNDQWAALASINGSFADTAAFEGGTTGTWWADRAQSIANSVTRAHDGTHSMVVTWPTAASGAAYCSTDLPPVETSYTYTISAWVFIPAGVAGALLQWGGVNGTGSATTNAWTRISVTVTRADAQDDRLYLVTTGSTTAGQQIWVDSVQVEIAASPSAFQTTGSTIYPLHSGYIERYPETWTQGGYWGWESLTSVDALALLPAVALSDCMTEDVMQDNPFLFWPLTSAAPSLGAIPAPTVSTTGTPTLTWHPDVVSGAYTTPTAPWVTWGATGGPGVDNSNCMTIAQGSTANTGAGGPAATLANAYTDTSGAGITYEVWFKIPTTGAASQCVLQILNAANDGISLWMKFDGTFIGQRDISGGGNAYTINGSVNLLDGAWHHAALTEHVSAGTVTATLYMDGLSIGSATYAGAVQDCLTVLVGFPQPHYALYLGTDGSLCRAACYPSALSATRIRSHWASGRGFPWDTTGSRVSRVLAWMPWTGPSNVPAGITQVSTAAGQSGRSVQDVINGCQATENGAFLATPVGVLTLVSRDHYYLAQTPAYTFGENVSGGETPYQQDVSAGTDITYVANLVTVTGASGNPQVAQDTVSQTMYGPRTLTVSTTHARDADALLLAQHLLNLYRTPHQRVVSVSVDPAGNPTAWPVVLGVKFGDRVRFNRRTSAGVTLSFDGFVDRIQHDVGVGTWKTSLQISPADPTPPLILGDATYGVLGQNVVKY